MKYFKFFIGYTFFVFCYFLFVDVSYSKNVVENEESIRLNGNSLNFINDFLLETYTTKKMENYNVYLDDFGGMYIDENQNIVLQIVGNSYKKAPIKKLSYNSNLTVDSVENSYKDLVNVYNFISNWFINFDNTDNISAFYIDVYSNLVIVELVDDSADKILDFKKSVINSSLVKIKKGSLGTRTANPGTALTSGTLGYRVTYNGSKGYLSPGQLIARDGKITNHQLGSITSTSWSGTLTDDKGKNPVKYSGLVATNVSNAVGDSGGPVYTQGLNEYFILGISTGSSNGKMLYTKSSVIKSKFGVEKY